MTAEPGGVQLVWEAEETGTGFRIYRRDARNREYGAPIQVAPAETDRFLDRGARLDNRYIYTVTTVAEVEPLVESAIAIEQEVNYLDRFAPPTPDNLVALPETGRVRLLWEPSRRRRSGGLPALPSRAQGRGRAAHTRADHRPRVPRPGCRHR